MASELKPCPFCGGTDVNLYHRAKAFMSWVSCKSCGLDAPSETGVTDEEAITYWNTRPAPVDANPLASNPVDDKIAPDTDGKRDSASDREGA